LRELLSELREKENDVDILLKHIKEYDMDYVEITAILKSSFILLLYNLIESTTCSCLEKIHQESSCYEYSCLSDKIRSVCEKYYFWKVENEKRKNSIQEKLNSGEFRMPPFRNYRKKLKGKAISGNIGAEKLKEIAQSYGVDLVDLVLYENDIFMVLTKRNDLAHGKYSFQGSCRQLTFRTISSIKDSVIAAMQELVESTIYFLDQKQYLK
jgi:hypothetical protein